MDVTGLASAQVYVIEESGLVIRHVLKWRDEGMYTCAASNSDGNRSMTAFLTVNGRLMFKLSYQVIINVVIFT